MQTYLEKKAIEARNESSVMNDYDKTETGSYSENHKDALSDGDVRGKGNGFGGHTHSIPTPGKRKGIDYSSFNTNNGGGLYDIEGINGKGGRNFLKTISLYNEQQPYGAHMIDTSANRADGQIIL